MSKIKVVYWSSTGNTEAMAQAIARGIESAGGQAELLEADGVSADDLKDDAVFALGCPERRSRCLALTTGETESGCASGQNVWRRPALKLSEARD